MQFEYDPQKSESNRLKHGIDFGEAQKLWRDDDYVEVELRWSDEFRFMVIGNIEAKTWAAICSIRNGKIRIISVHRARPNEVRIYDEDR